MSSTMNMVNQPSNYKKIEDLSFYTNNTQINQSFTNPFINPVGSDLSSKPSDSNQKTMNISKSNIYANCDQKCSYGFDYSNTLLIAKNNRTELLFSCEQSQAPSVTYNTNQYNVSSFSLFSPSLHQWNGNEADGEIIIEHTPVYGGKNLYTCIPIITTAQTTTNTNTSLITEIIKETAKSAPGKGDTSNLTVNSFNLQNIVPRAPFYSYYGEGDSYKGDFIVFDKTNAILLTKETLSLLTSLIKPSYIIMFGGFLYYNPLGPNQLETDIYISCQPTGSSNESSSESTNNTSTSVNPSLNDLSEILNNQWFLILLVAVFFIFTILLINYLFNNFVNGSHKKSNTVIVS